MADRVNKGMNLLRESWTEWYLVHTGMISAFTLNGRGGAFRVLIRIVELLVLFQKDSFSNFMVNR